jgi:hypothetical protein
MNAEADVPWQTSGLAIHGTNISLRSRPLSIVNEFIWIAMACSVVRKMRSESPPLAKLFGSVSFAENRNAVWENQPIE